LKYPLPAAFYKSLLHLEPPGGRSALSGSWILLLEPPHGALISWSFLHLKPPPPGASFSWSALL